MSQQQAADPSQPTQNSGSTAPTMAELTKRAKELSTSLGLYQAMVTEFEKAIQLYEAEASSQLDQNLFDEAEATQDKIRVAIGRMNDASAERTAIAV